jgi:hypothetical protein
LPSLLTTLNLRSTRWTPLCTDLAVDKDDVLMRYLAMRSCLVQLWCLVETHRSFAKALECNGLVGEEGVLCCDKR